MSRVLLVAWVARNMPELNEELRGMLWPEIRPLFNERFGTIFSELTDVDYCCDIWLKALQAQHQNAEPADDFGTKEVDLWECKGCGNLHQGQITSCDCGCSGFTHYRATLRKV